METSCSGRAELSLKSELHWSKIGLYPHHGIALPLASLRSARSGGIGEFLDLKPLIRWCRSLGFDTIQLLPLCESGTDPSPYNLLSSCALNPVYLSLIALPFWSQWADLQEGVEALRRLSSMPRTQYKEVRRLKLDLLFAYFQRAPLETAHLDLFLQRERSWLHPYASMQARREERPFLFYVFLQYIAFQQLEEVSLYARQEGCFLKGDIPAFVGVSSADYEAFPELFLHELRAGAPPDFYNPLGQGWGFPILNFHEMERTHFTWWRERLRVAERFFQLYRIDHVIGLFRIWAMRPGSSPKEGYYLPSVPALWEKEGRCTLEALLNHSTLLPIAEDLGVVPDCVSRVLHEYGICGTKIVRWQRRADHSYIPYAEYERLSLTSVSTHDAPPLRLWWRTYPEEARAFAAFKGWTYHPEMTFAEQREILSDSHQTPSLFHINLLQEYLTLFPELSWAQIEEERINIPGTELTTNWTYRFRPFLEEFTTHAPLAEVLRNCRGA